MSLESLVEYLMTPRNKAFKKPLTHYVVAAQAPEASKGDLSAV